MLALAEHHVAGESVSTAPKRPPFMDGVRAEMERDPETGQFVSKKGKKTVIARIARSILEQEEHIEMLAAQARNGVGSAPDQLPPATHKLLCEYGYGAVPKGEERSDERAQEMRALREAAKAWIEAHPEQARVIDISVHQAATRMELPAPKTDEENDDPAA